MTESITKQTANAITLTRMVLMPLSLLFVDRPWIFCTLWLVSGATDAIDGMVARRLRIESELGAQLDWWADVVMFGVLVTFFWLYLRESVPWVGTAILLILAVRLVNLAIGWFRFKSVGALHSWSNKAAGIAVFLAPALYLITNNELVLWVAAIVAGISALEELVILLIMPRYEVDVTSIFTISSTR